MNVLESFLILFLVLSKRSFSNLVSLYKEQLAANLKNQVILALHLRKSNNAGNILISYYVHLKIE